MLFSKKYLKVLQRSCISILLFSYSFYSMADESTIKQGQVPGYYRMQLGDYVITALYDGYTRIDNKLLKGITAQQAKKQLTRHFIDNVKGVQTSINGFLVQMPNHLILFDAGAQDCLGESAGKLVDNLKLAGYQPEQVNTIFLTHLHPDHVCGISNKGKRVFRNATLYVNQAEAGYWLSKATEQSQPASRKAIFSSIREAIAPYQASNKFKTFTDLSPIKGVRLISSHGHTPGHVSYLISSKGKSLLIWGDIIHSHSIQFKQPEIAIDFDSDAKKAISSRKKILAYAVLNKLWVAGAHLPFPGIGHIIKENNSYEWLPIEYAPMEESK